MGLLNFSFFKYALVVNDLSLPLLTIIIIMDIITTVNNKARDKNDEKGKGFLVDIAIKRRSGEDKIGKNMCKKTKNGLHATGYIL